MEKLREGQSYTSKLPIAIYDTSSIILQIKDKVPIQKQVVELIGTHIPVLLDTTLRELRKLAVCREWRTRKAVELALSIAQRRFSIYRTGLKDKSISADEAILKVATRLSRENNKVFVVTCDLGLRRALEDRGLKVIFYREAKRRLTTSGEE